MWCSKNSVQFIIVQALFSDKQSEFIIFSKSHTVQNPYQGNETCLDELKVTVKILNFLEVTHCPAYYQQQKGNRDLFDPLKLEF